jgi:hypothetical protein
LPALCRENIPKGGITPLWPPAQRAKRGKGRFSNAYVNSMLRKLILKEFNRAWQNVLDFSYKMAL